MGIAISLCFILMVFFLYLPKPVKAVALDNPKIADVSGFTFVIGLLLLLGISSTKAFELALIAGTFFTLFIFTMSIIRSIFGFWK